MVMVSKFSNFPDKLSENGELREYELSGSDCVLSFIYYQMYVLINYSAYQPDNYTVNTNK